MPFKQDRNDELMDALRAEVQFRYEPQFAWKSAVSSFLALPALRAFWPMSGVWFGNPLTLDMAGADFKLTNNNTALFGYDNLAPYVEFDGVDQYLSRADGGVANWADITGTEAYIQPAQRGLTFGGWFNLDTLAPGANAGLIGKFNDAANQRSYLLYFSDAGNQIVFGVSTDGIAEVLVAGSVISASLWYYIAGRYDPGAELKIWVNAATATNVAGIPASIFDSTADFNIGAYANGLAATCLDGRASMCFLCAAALSDAIVGQAFQQSRAMFGV